MKKMHRQFVKREDLNNLRGEIKMMHRTSHPNVVQFLGASWDKPPNVCILLELMPGGALHEFIHGGDQQVDYQGKALGIALDVCRGLLYLHTFPHGTIIHRDVKPGLLFET